MKPVKVECPRCGASFTVSVKLGQRIPSPRPGQVSFDLEVGDETQEHLDKCYPPEPAEESPLG